MVKNAIMAATLTLLLSAPPAVAFDPEQPLQSFVAAHGPQTILELDDAGHGLTFAGRFVSPTSTVDPASAAASFLETWSGLMGLDPQWDLGPGTVVSLSGLSYVRLEQIHDGVPVQAGDVVLTVDRAGNVLQVSSGYAWIDSFADPEPCMSVDQAAAIVMGQMPELRPTTGFGLVYVPMPGATAPLAWALRFTSSSGPERPEVLVDAHSGQILHAYDTMIYYRQAQVYDPNPVASPSLLTVTLPNMSSDSHLVGTYARAWRCLPGSGWDMCPDREQTAVPDASGDYFFTPVEGVTTDQFAEVMAYYHMDKINTHMEDTYGHAITCDGHRYMDVHVNMDYENAWYGDQDDDGCADVTIGQGAQDYAWDAAILYHEFGHGINHSLNRISGWAFDGLGPDHSPQGIDEGLADYWAATLIGTSVIGEYAGMGTPGELGIRDVSHFASCPDGLYGEGHYDSPIISSTLWQIRTAIGQDKTDRLALALLSSSTREVDFDEAGRVLLSQASALRTSGVLTTADVTDVENAVAEHTLVGCERILPMEDGDSHVFLAVGYGSADVPSGVQFSMHAPPTATRVTANFDQLSIGGGYTVYVNRNSPVHFTLEGWSVTIDDYDFRYDASPERVSYTMFSDPPVEPNTTYYFTYVHNSETMVLGVQAIITAPAAPDVTVDAIEDTTLDSLEDPGADVPSDESVDTAVDVEADTTTLPDAQTDTIDGTITSHGGCGCSVAR